MFYCISHQIHHNLVKSQKTIVSIQCINFTCPRLWHPELVWYQIYFWITIKMLEDQLLIYYFILYTQIIEVYSMSKVKLKYWYDWLFKLTHKLFIDNNYKQLLDEVFVISRIIKVKVGVIRRSGRLRLITLTSTLIILDITSTESNNCFIIHWMKKTKTNKIKMVVTV